MSINGSGIRDTAQVLNISKNTVVARLKKEKCIAHVNPNFHTCSSENAPEVILKKVCVEAELDEQWSFVGKKSNQRWLWCAVDHATNTVLAFIFGKRKDVVFKELKALLDPFGINRYYTDDWGAYEHHIDTENHEIGSKQSTQKIERENLNFRT